MGESYVLPGVSGWHAFGSTPTRLYCFAHAGGTASKVFQKWREALAPQVQVVPIDLPGRGALTSERVIGDYEALVERLSDKLTEDLRSALDFGSCPSYAIFGHSAGARFGFAAAVRAAARIGREPSHCFLSAAAPFSAAPRERRRSHLSDDEWLTELQTLGGTPSHLLADESLMSIVLPVLRADFCAVEGSHVDAGLRLGCPLTLIAADRDAYVSANGVWEWSRYTSASCRKVLLRGDHFSVLSGEGPLLDAIQDGLAFDDDSFWPSAF